MNETPWKSLPRIDGAITLTDAADAATEQFSALFDLPNQSACTLSRITVDGDVITTRWRDTGRLGWYPASCIKWVTAAMACGVATKLDLPLDCTIQLDADASVQAPADPPRTLRELMLGETVMSDNDFFCTLQEFVGFADTYAAMKRWGCTDSMIRRHFRRPRFNHSRKATIHFPPPEVGNAAQREPLVLEPRAPADIPLNGWGATREPVGNDPGTGLPDDRNANRESNYFTTDDAVRCVIATLCGPTRDTRHFDWFTHGIGYTNQRYVANGLARVTRDLPQRPMFVSLNKPGWWPPDGNNAEWVYIYDMLRGEHYAMAIYTQGTNEEAAEQMGSAAAAIFGAIHRGEWALV